MLQFKNHFMIVKCLIFISIFIDAYLQYNNRHLTMTSLFIFIAMMLVNDYVRSAKLKSDTKYSYISLFFSICASSLLQYIVVGASTNLYQYCPLFEFFNFKRVILKIFISIHFSLYLLHFFITPLNLQSTNINMSFFLTFSLMILFYFSIIGMLYNKKKLEIEKEEVKQLNEKLKLANIKLQKYSLDVEEAAISRERTRVAQELHDSLGHSLMALVMHLEFAKKIYTIKPKKVEEVLSQSEKIAKASICDLRKAVTLLNSELEIKDFDNSIEKLINNFYLFSNIKMIFNTNININDLSSIIKTSIYKIIQESITNSLKHGNATEINIKITTTRENVELIITDNGIGCSNVIKSNGLNGIENRINLLRGIIYYLNHNDSGFGIRVFIPL
jgi:signal transduction histidine kinase